MKKSTLEEAIFEAKRFIMAAEKALETVRVVTHDQRGYPFNNPCEYWNGIDSGACKRASLDLTRSLAKLRGNK